MKTNHFIHLTASASILLIFSSTPTLASSIHTSNRNTGESSRNQITINERREVIDQTNTSITFSNTFNFDLRTGNNETNNNTGDGAVKSGSIAVELVDKNQPTPTQPTTITHQSIATATTSRLTTGGEGSVIIVDQPTTSVTTENSNTGANSDNQSDIDLSTRISVIKTVVQNENNDFTLNLRTGNNAANNNTGNGIVESGNITVLVKKETLPPLRPTPPSIPSPVSQPQPLTPAEQPKAPTAQPTTIPTPIQEITPLVAQKLAALVPSQPAQIVTPAAQPTQPQAPTAQEKKLPTAGAETPLLATLLSAGSLRLGRYLRQKRKQRELLYRHKKPW